MDSDEENKENKEKEKKPETKTEYTPLQPFKDLYPHSDVVRAMKEFGE